MRRCGQAPHCVPCRDRLPPHVPPPPPPPAARPQYASPQYVPAMVVERATACGKVWGLRSAASDGVVEGAWQAAMGRRLGSLCGAQSHAKESRRPPWTEKIKWSDWARAASAGAVCAPWGLACVGLRAVCLQGLPSPAVSPPAPSISDRPPRPRQPDRVKDWSFVPPPFDGTLLASSADSSAAAAPADTAAAAAAAGTAAASAAGKSGESTARDSSQARGSSPPAATEQRGTKRSRSPPLPSAAGMLGAAEVSPPRSTARRRLSETEAPAAGREGGVPGGAGRAGGVGYQSATQGAGEARAAAAMGKGSLRLALTMAKVAAVIAKTSAHAGAHLPRPSALSAWRVQRPSL